MKTSDSITKIAPALLKAQAAITYAAKDSTNPHYRHAFASLPAVIDAVKPALNAAKIVFIQTAGTGETTLSLTTRLIHESGEWLEDTTSCPLLKPDPQGFGSAMTYLRCYCLAAIIGLYQDDDDAERGVMHEGSPAKVIAKTPVPVVIPKEVGNPNP